MITSFDDYIKWLDNHPYMPNRESLDSIGCRMETDKASQFSRTYAKPHDYLRHVERFFEPMRDKPIKFLEIGVGGGESIQTWREYFLHHDIYGVDIVSGTNEWNTPAVGHKGYTFACGDQSNPEFWKRFIEVYGGEWDVVIDDGSHIASAIRTTFNSLWPYLKSGGIYEIEDLGVAHDAHPWIVEMGRYLLGDSSGLDCLHIAPELAIIRKK